jgi:hypothetical protein
MRVTAVTEVDCLCLCTAVESSRVKLRHAISLLPFCPFCRLDQSHMPLRLREGILLFDEQVKSRVARHTSQKPPTRRPSFLNPETIKSDQL